ILPRDGILWCKDAPSPPPGTISQYSEGNTSLLRFDNKDLSPCIAITFQVAVTNAGKKVEITWDDIWQPYAVLQTETTWPLELVDPAFQGLPKPTKFSIDGGVTTLIAPTCLSSGAPASLGTLGAAITDTVTTSIKINFTVAPTAYPFAIVVPSEQAESDP